MNASSIFQLAFILQTSSFAAESPARKALENAANSDFFWLLISTGFVAIGIAFEYPEVKHDFIEWLRDRKHSWVVDPRPTTRGTVPLWSLIGFLIVTAGVAGEGVYEGLLGINDTKIRKMDESSLTADELQIAQLQRDNLTLRKQAGDAAQSAHDAAVDAKNAKSDSGQAKTLATGARKEADSFENGIRTANENAASALRDKAEALKQTAAAQAELNRIRSPRSLTNESTLVTTLAALKGTEYTLMVFEDSEAFDFTRAIERVLNSAGWVRKQHAGMLIGIPNMHLFGDDSPGVDACLETGVNVHVETDESVESIRSKAYPDLPKSMQAAFVLRSLLVLNISPSDQRNVGNNIEIDSQGQRANFGGDAPLLICVGKKP